MRSTPSASTRARPATSNKAALAAVAALGIEVEGYRQRVLDGHTEVLRWEGRSGFQQPYPELSQAYRRVAEAVDDWQRAHEQQKVAEARAEAKRGEVMDLEFQIKELRAALANKRIARREQEAGQSEVETWEARRRHGDQVLDHATAFARLCEAPGAPPAFLELERRRGVSQSRARSLAVTKRSTTYGTSASPASSATARAI